MNERRRIVGLAAVIASNGIAMMAYALLQPVLAVKLELAGASNLLIGIVVSIWSLGVLLGGPFYGSMTRWLGQLPSMVVSVVVCAGIVAIMAVVQNPIAWAALQFISGVAFGYFWVLSESWINVLAVETSRARTTSIYVLSVGFGSALGPLLLAFIGNSGSRPFIVCASLALMSLAPLVFLRGIESHLLEKSSIRLSGALRLLRILIVVGLVAGFADQAPTGLLPTFVLKEGGSVSLVATLLFAFGLGKMIFIVPIGAVADRFSISVTLIACSIACALLALALPIALNHPTLLHALVFLWGATFDAFYALGLALMGTRFIGAELAAVNTLFVMLHSVGSFGGTSFLGWAMDVAGPLGYVLTIGAVALLVPAAFATRRLMGKNQTAGQVRNSGAPSTFDP